jgi:hypothetical protein
LNIAVERGRLEEGEDFQLALPTAMFFYSQVECLLSLFALLTVKQEDLDEISSPSWRL